MLRSVFVLSLLMGYCMGLDCFVIGILEIALLHELGSLHCKDAVLLLFRLSTNAIDPSDSMAVNLSALAALV